VRLARGPDVGIVLTRPPEQITLADVWRAVHPAEPLIGVHSPSAADPLGRAVPDRLRAPFAAVEEAMLGSLARVTLADLLAATTEQRRRC
jgi:DNA-binding IscR family transcriptional regulator